MFINFLIVIFMIFIVYLLFSNNTIIEGATSKKKLKIGKKGGLKKRAKKTKKAVKEAIEDGEEAVDDAMDDGEDAVDEAGKTLPTPEQLPRMVNDLRDQVDKISVKVEALAAETPTISASSIADEPEDGDLGI